MYSFVETVTPELAAEWLAKSKGNRTHRESSIRMYANDMKNGRWRLTHQGIAFDEQGVLVDGHHRLLAVVKCGIAVQMYISNNVPPEAKANIDTNMVRRATDTYAIVTGEKAGHHQTAICMCIEWFPKIPNTSLTYGREQQIQLIEQHMEAAEYACQIRSRHVPRFNKGGRAAIARAWYVCKESGELGRLDEFLEVLKTGVPTEGENDTAAIALYRYITTRIGPGASINIVHSTYKRTQSAIHKFLNRQNVTVIRECQEDLFPLPQKYRVIKES
jgi:hypothetical protein